MPFLTAEWKMLAMANYAVDPDLLKPYVPAFTELELWQGRCYVSLVGFLFVDTRLRGLRIPFHTDFEEVNLRFYVRRKIGGEWRRGVVFISEIVPKPALALVANRVYKEHYRCMPMKHAWHTTPEAMTIQYEWRNNGDWNSICVVTDTTSTPIPPDSEEAFITEHYFGYSRIDDGRTTEYQVDHPSWNMFAVQGYEIRADFGRLYGPAFAFLEDRVPESVLLAEGSRVSVDVKRVIKSL